MCLVPIRSGHEEEVEVMEVVRLPLLVASAELLMGEGEGTNRLVVGGVGGRARPWEGGGGVEEAWLFEGSLREFLPSSEMTSLLALSFCVDVGVLGAGSRAVPGLRSARNKSFGEGAPGGLLAMSLLPVATTLCSSGEVRVCVERGDGSSLGLFLTFLLLDGVGDGDGDVENATSLLAGDLRITLASLPATVLLYFIRTCVVPSRSFPLRKSGRSSSWCTWWGRGN